MDTKFSMYVISNGSPEYYPNNTLSKFSVKLPHSINLPISYNEKWGIALDGIGLSSKFTSDYSSNIEMPIMIELLAYADPYKCPIDPDPDQDPEDTPCINETTQYNTMISNISGFCHTDEYDKINYKKDLHLITQLDDWVLTNVKLGELVERKIVGINIRDTKSIVYNFYYNTLKNQKSFDKFIKNLEQHELIVTKNDYNITLTNKPNHNIERIFFIRKDLFDKASISQNIITFEETNQIIMDEGIMFSNNTSAKLLNRSTTIMNNITYVILVMNKEHTNLQIDFEGFEENFLSIPNIIKIKCDNVRAQIFNNTHSKDLEVIKPKFKNLNEHYFHEFENPVYVKLLNTSLRDLTFELTDEFDNHLNLKEGIPTVLHVSFKRMNPTNKSFSVRLAPFITEEANTISKFSNVLPNILNLDENWRVGLKEITFPSRVKTFPGNYNEIVIRELNAQRQYIPHDLKEHKFIIPDGMYDEDSFLEILNSKVESLNFLKFTIEEGILYVTATKNCSVGFPYTIAMLLNMPVFGGEHKMMTYTHECLANEKTKLGYEINWNVFRPAYLMVYSDLVKTTLVSGEYTNILRIVPVKYEDSDNEYQSVEFKNMEFKEIANRFTNIINIEIRSHSGDLVAFDSNFLSLHLYFTNNPFNKDI